MIDPQASTNPVPQWRNLRSTCGGFRYHEYNREERCDNFGELDLGESLLKKIKNKTNIFTRIKMKKNIKTRKKS